MGQLAYALDAIEELERLLAHARDEIAALKEHTHGYRTGRGEGHNNTAANTGPPMAPDHNPPAGEHASDSSDREKDHSRRR